MAMYRYFRGVDKLPKLPDPTGSLSMKVLSSSIILANAGMKSMPEESVGKGKWGCYVKLLPDVKAQIGKRAAEHGVAATIAILSCKNFSPYGILCLLIHSWI